MVKNRGTLFLDHFWAFLGIVGQNGEVPGPLLGKGLKKTVHSYGAPSDALQRVYFVSPVSLPPKYTIWRASEVAP